MSTFAAPEQGTPSRWPWWCEPQAGLLLLLVVGAYFLRLGQLPLRGEEPTRAQIAFEMFQRHDWLVPRLQGDPFPSRPPLQNWTIAASALLFGNRGVWAVRFPSALALLLTVLLIYGYSRLFLSRFGAFAGAAAFATFGEMFQMGPEAETEPVFILLVTASLLLWHWGWVRRWPAALTWTAGYGFMALAVLAKGPQPPVYFLGAVGAYVLLTRDWRRLFSVGHLIGALVGGAIFAAWFIPAYFEVGATTLQGILMSDTAMRFRDWTVSDVATHLAVYPLVILGGTLPWSPFLLAYLNRDFYRSIGAARPMALFVGAAVVLAFPTCWIPPSGQSRYFAPLYPCIAVLIGLALARTAAAPAASFPRASLRLYIWSAAAMMALAGAAMLVVSFGLRGRPGLAAYVEPPLTAAAFAAACTVLAAAAFRAGGAEPSRVRTGVLALTIFMALTFAGVLMDVRLRLAVRPEADVARLKERLPTGERLVSFDHVATLFTYLYGDPIPARPWPNAVGDATDVHYFCFTVFEGMNRPALPFAWEKVAVIDVDRNHHTPPENVVVVGRRLPAPPGHDVAQQKEPNLSRP